LEPVPPHGKPPLRAPPSTELLKTFARGCMSGATDAAIETFEAAPKPLFL
jgi:hypothetical protein